MPVRLPDTLTRLVNRLEKLPSVGPRTALRLAFFLLDCNEEYSRNLAESILQVQKDISTCNICGCLTDSLGCAICNDVERDSKTICVVSRARDVFTIEESGSFNGYYHVLGGLLSPLDRIGPSELKISSLIDRLDTVKEVILATSPTVEGDATALYLAGLISAKGVSVTRIAYGLPAGGDIEFTDSVTLSRALEGRRSIEK